MKKLNAAISYEKDRKVGEEQAAMLCQYFWKTRWVTEPDEVCKDKGLRREAYWRAAGWELNRKLIAEKN